MAPSGALYNMAFKKGNKPWNQGLKYTKQFKKRLNTDGLKLGHGWNYNADSHKVCADCGKDVWRKSERCKECFVKWKFQIKENHPRWEGGVTSEKHRLRSSNKWKLWREAVFRRDNYVCKECGASKVYLEPHHIIPIRSDRSKVYDINNGITLCRPCHQKTIWKESNFVEKYSQLVAA